MSDTWSGSQSIIVEPNIEISKLGQCKHGLLDLLDFICSFVSR